MTVFLVNRDEKDLTKFALSIQQLGAGRSNAVGTFTLTPSATTTTVTDPNCAVGSTPIPVPATPSAATEIGNGTMYLSAVANGSFTFTHANSIAVARTFRYAILG